MVRIHHNFSSTHSLFARYTIDDSSSLVPYVGTPPGTYVPGFPAFHLARNQYGTIQDRTTFGPQWINELRFGVNRTTASSSVDNTHPGLSTSLTPGLPFGMIEFRVSACWATTRHFLWAIIRPFIRFRTSCRGQSAATPSNSAWSSEGSNTTGRWISLRYGLYSFPDLTPYGLPASSNNPALEFFLKGVPLSFAGVNPSNADSERGYRETFASGFAQDFVRVNSRLTVNLGLRYDFYSNPTKENGRLSTFPNPATDSAPTVGKLFAGTRVIFSHPRQALRGTSSATAKLWCAADSVSIATSLRPTSSAPAGSNAVFRFEEFVFPQFLNPQNAAATLTVEPYATTYPRSSPTR